MSGCRPRPRDASGKIFALASGNIRDGPHHDDWSVTEAARFIAERGVIEEGAPVLVRFITQVASRFGVVVTQKVAAQTLPVVGALGGGAVNYAFIEHFQEVALGHFTVRRLERVYGKNVVQAEYERLARDH